MYPTPHPPAPIYPTPPLLIPPPSTSSPPASPAPRCFLPRLWLGPCIKLLGVGAGRQEYAQQVPRDQSLLHNLMAARRKDTGQPLSDLQICAQAFIFILAGLSVSRMGLGLLALRCATVCVSDQETTDCYDSIWAAILVRDVWALCWTGITPLGRAQAQLFKVCKPLSHSTTLNCLICLAGPGACS